MAKIFFKLYLLLVASLAVFVVVVINLDKLLQPTIENYYYDLAHGTVQLTENRLRKTPPEQWPKMLAQINSTGGYPLRLEVPANYKLNKRTIDKLSKQKFAFQKIDGADYLYVRFIGITEVLEIPMQQSLLEQEQRLARSTFEIIEHELLQYPKTHWPAELKEISKLFYFPVSLLNMNALSLNAEQLKLLEQGQVAFVMINEEIEYFYHRIKDSQQVIRLGPFATPATLSYLQGILLALLAVVLATSALVWVRPLARDLKDLDTTANGFGQGNFSIRAGIGKHSAVAALANTFNTMANRIQSLISSHKELTNAVSHELRTPISRLRFAIEMLQTARTEKDRDRFINSMRADIDELGTLVAELLTYASFDRDRPDIVMQQHSVQAWLKQVVEQASIGLDGISLRYYLADNCMADNQQQARFEPRLLARALSNLLDNACRYAVREVHVTYEKIDGNHYLTVDDDGPGIPENNRQQIFEAFSRLDSSRARDTGGYGLGLAIVNRIMQWHQGSVSVESAQLGGALSGARFILRWPL